MHLNMSGYHCVDYCQNEPKSTVGEMKRHSAQFKLLIQQQDTHSQPCSNMQLVYNAPKKPYKNTTVMSFSINSKLKRQEVVKSPFTSLCPSSEDTLTNSVTHTIEIDTTTETRRK